MSEQEKNFFGFGAWEIIILICVVGFFVWISIPNFIPDGRGDRKTRTCINNLRQIDAAANQFALEHQLTNGTRIHFPDDLTPYCKLNSAGKIPPCPAGGTYQIGKVGEQSVCSLGSTVTPAHILP